MTSPSNILPTMCLSSIWPLQTDKYENFNLQGPEQRCRRWGKTFLAATLLRHNNNKVNRRFGTLLRWVRSRRFYTCTGDCAYIPKRRIFLRQLWKQIPKGLSWSTLVYFWCIHHVNIRIRFMNGSWLCRSSSPKTFYMSMSALSKLPVGKGSQMDRVRVLTTCNRLLFKLKWSDL